MDLSTERGIGDAEPDVDDLRERHDAKAGRVDAAQILRERDVVVVRVVVAADVVRVVSENRYAHAR